MSKEEREQAGQTQVGEGERQALSLLVAALRVTDFSWVPKPKPSL